MKLTTTNFLSYNIRVLVDEHGKEWFVAKDVAKVLGYKNPLDAIQKHCRSAIKDGFAFRDSIGREQKTPIIPRADVFRLVTKSKLPAAEEFEKWVYEEVLPMIQKTGAYYTTQTLANLLQDPKTMLQLLTTCTKEQEERLQPEQFDSVRRPFYCSRF